MIKKTTSTPLGCIKLTNVEIVDAPDDEFGFDAMPESGPMPKHGWDNAIDVAEFKRKCQDAAHFPQANVKGLASSMG